MTTFHVRPLGRTPIQAPTLHPSILRMTIVNAWAVTDGELEACVTYATTGCDDGVGAGVADRIAELLNRHGLVDVPDGVPT